MSTKSTILLSDANEHWYVEHGDDDNIYLEFGWGKGLHHIDTGPDGTLIVVKRGTSLHKAIIERIGLWGIQAVLISDTPKTKQKYESLKLVIRLAKEFGVTRDEMIALLDTLG